MTHSENISHLKNIFESYYKQFFYKDVSDKEQQQKWLTKEFEKSISNQWIVQGNEFLVFSERTYSIMVHHLCVLSELSIILLLRQLEFNNKKKQIIVCLQKSDKKTIEFLLSIGCKSVRNQLAKIDSNDHYIVEVPSTFATQLTLLPSTVLSQIF